MSNYDVHYLSQHRALRPQSNSFCYPSQSGPSKSMTETSPRSHHHRSHNQSTTQRKSTKSPSIREEYLNQIQKALSSQQLQQQQTTLKSNVFEQPCMDVNSTNVSLLVQRVVDNIKNDQILATLQLNKTSSEFLQCRVDEIISNECISELNSSVKLLKNKLKISSKETAHARSQVEHFESLLQQNAKQISSLNQTIQMLSEKLDQCQTEKQQAVQTSNRLASAVRTAATTESMKQSLVRISADAAVRIADMQVSHDQEVAAIKEMHAKAMSNYQNMLEQQYQLEEQNTSHTKATIGTLSKNITELQSKLAQASRESGAKISELESKNSILSNELQSLRNQNDSWKEKIRELESASHSNARASKDKYANITTELVKSQEETKVLLLKNGLLQNSLNEFQKQTEIEKEKQLDRLAELKESYEERVREVLQQLSAGEDQLLLAVSESEGFKDRLREKEALFSAISQQLTDAKNAVSAGTNRITEVSSELQRLKQVNSGLQSKINQLNSKLQQQQQQYQQMSMQCREQELKVESLEKQAASSTATSATAEVQKCKSGSREELVMELKQNLFEKDLKLRQSNQRVDHLEIRLRVQQGSYNKRVTSLTHELRELNSKVMAMMTNSSSSSQLGDSNTVTANRNSRLLELMEEQQVEIMQKEGHLEQSNCEIERLQEVVEDLTAKNLVMMEAASKKSVEEMSMREGSVIYTAGAAFEQADSLERRASDVSSYETGQCSEMELERVVKNRLENAKKYFFGVISRMNQENNGDANQVSKQLFSAKKPNVGGEFIDAQYGNRITESSEEYTHEVVAPREVSYVKLQETLAQYEKEIKEIEQIVAVGVEELDNLSGVQSEIQKHKDQIQAIRAKVLGGVKHSGKKVEQQEVMSPFVQPLLPNASSLRTNNQSSCSNRKRSDRLITPILLGGDENKNDRKDKVEREEDNEDKSEILTATFNSNKNESNRAPTRTRLGVLSTSCYFNQRNQENHLRSSFEEGNAKSKVFVDEVLRKLAEQKHSKKSFHLKQ